MGSRTGQAAPPVDAAAPAPRSVVREYTETILFCVLAIVFLRAFVFQQSEIPSGSMEDTLLVGDYVLVNRFLYAPVSFEWERALLPRREVARGDVVVFKHPPSPEQDFIKRVIGVPGDTVTIVGGRVFVNGRPLPEPYVASAYRTAESFGPLTVGADSYFVMGDHRNRSADSREWGEVDRALLKGRAFMVLFSTDTTPDPSRPAGTVTPWSLVKRIWDIAFNSRWERTFRQIR